MIYIIMSIIVIIWIAMGYFSANIAFNELKDQYGMKESHRDLFCFVIILIFPIVFLLGFIFNLCGFRPK